MNLYMAAIKDRRKITLIYETANSSKTAEDFTRLRDKGDNEISSWLEKYGSLDKSKLNRLILDGC